MHLSEARRAATGAFYTPPMWADLAAEYIARTFPDPRSFLFYDPAAGEGALLSAARRKFGDIPTAASTLEPQDVSLLMAAGHAPAIAADFLASRPLQEIVPPCVWQAAREGRLIVFTNPPFLRLPAGRCPALSSKYATNEATELFFARILSELRPAALFSLSKISLLQSPASKRWREIVQIFPRVIPRSTFVCPSTSWPGLRGAFPILFSGYFGG